MKPRTRSFITAFGASLLLLPLFSQAPKLQVNDAAKKGPERRQLPANPVKVTAPSDGQPWFIGLPYEVRWTGGLLAANYKVQLRTPAVANGGIYDIAASVPGSAQKVSYTVPANFGQTGIPFKVCILPAGPGDTILAESTAFVILQPLGFPTIISPICGTDIMSGSTTFGFKWSQVPYADSYELSYMTSYDNGQSWSNSTVVPVQGTSYILALGTGGRVRWCVRGVKNSPVKHVGPWTNWCENKYTGVG